MVQMTSAQIKRSFLIAIIVGTLLIVINQLDALINGPYTIALFLKEIVLIVKSIKKNSKLKK